MKDAEIYVETVFSMEQEDGLSPFFETYTDDDYIELPLHLTEIFDDDYG